MNGGAKILDRIKSDCDERISIINAQADEATVQALENGKKQAELVAVQITEKANEKAKQMKSMAQSRAELEIRNALLKRKRQEIDITFNAILEHLLALDDKTYFDTIYKLAKKLDEKSGEVLLNSKDLARLPSDFETKLKNVGINATVCKTPRDISGGFILKCGDVEENMVFDAILSDKRDMIEDLINHQLFAQ